MGGILTVRLDASERKKLRALQQERGCKNLSQVVRLMCGFPRDDQHESFEGSDDVDSVTTLTKWVMRSIDRQDDARHILTRIARHLNVPMQTPGGTFDADDLPPIDPGRPFETRGGHQHPILPSGFER